MHECECGRRNLGLENTFAFRMGNILTCRGDGDGYVARRNELLFYPLCRTHFRNINPINVISDFPHTFFFKWHGKRIYLHFHFGLRNTKNKNELTLISNVFLFIIFTCFFSSSFPISTLQQQEMVIRESPISYRRRSHVPDEHWVRAPCSAASQSIFQNAKRKWQQQQKYEI